MSGPWAAQGRTGARWRGAHARLIEGRGITGLRMGTMFEMGGYEIYVWGSVLLAVGVYAWNLFAPVMQRRAVLERLADSEGDESSGDAS